MSSEALTPRKKARMESDWRASRTMAQRMEHLFENPSLLSDVSFSIEKPGSAAQVFKAHKFILSSASPVFQDLFSGSSSVKGEYVNGVVHVMDVEPDAFKILLRFVYTDDFEEYLTMENVISVAVAASKYCLPLLLTGCEKYLMRKLTVQQAVFYAGQAHRFDLSKLFEKICQRIDRDVLSALSSYSADKVDSAAMAVIVGRGSLVVAEVDLFEAVKKWAIRKCGQRGLSSPSKDDLREALGGCLQKIRFPLMTQADVAKPDGPAMLLTAAEMGELFLHFGGHPPADAKFSARKRLPALFTCTIFERSAWETLVRRRYSYYDVYDVSKFKYQSCCLRHDAVTITTRERSVTFHGLSVATDMWQQSSFSMTIQSGLNTVTLRRGDFGDVDTNQTSHMTTGKLKTPLALVASTEHWIRVWCDEPSKHGFDTSHRVTVAVQPPWATVKYTRVHRAQCAQCNGHVFYGFIRDLLLE